MQDVTLLYKAKPNTKKGTHFGSRIVFDNDGYLYFTVGDRGKRDENPQDLSRDGGKVYRLMENGDIPTDNPFVDVKDAKTAIFSYGHRNPQGMTKHPVTERYGHMNMVREGVMKSISYKQEKTMAGPRLPMVKITLALPSPKTKRCLAWNNLYTIGFHRLLLPEWLLFTIPNTLIGKGIWWLDH